MGSTGIPKVFIVEDNFMYSYVLESTLKESENMKVTSFSKGEECIELINNNPDVVILDYNLEGGMTGLDTFNAIRAQKPHVPIIILSGQTDVQLAADILKAGAFDYIEKKSPEKTMEKLRASVLKALSKNR